MKRFFITIVLLFATITVSLARENYTINESWKFAKGDVQGVEKRGFDDSSWQIVSVPHTWNVEDTADETKGYYRGAGWYRRNVNVDKQQLDKQIYACFEGANQVAELYVNGRKAGSHTGGYTRFVFDVTPYIVEGDNLFAVKVDNSYNADIAPLSADFTFFGGLYRDVSLLFTPKTHIATSHYASTGVYISTPKVSEKSAQVDVRTLVDNKLSVPAKIKVKNVISDPQGKVVATKTSDLLIGANATAECTQNFSIANPELWDTQNPNLYSVVTTIADKQAVEIDKVANPLGLRWFSFDADKGFFLNGKPTKLIGTSRHQDFYNKGNALRDELHVRDVVLLKQMGGNFLRVSHYPQDPVVMQMCDRLGILTSVEIPVVNAITDTPAFEHNCDNMAREMVCQDFNSPSVILWAYMNEVMLRPPYDKEDTVAQAKYFKAVERIATTIENTIRKADPYRYTMLPCHGNPRIYQSAGLTKLPMVLGWNLYSGWYGNNLGGFEKQVEEIHSMFPTQAHIITEYGADVDPRLHSFDSKRFDFTVEYGDIYHEHYIKAIMERDYIAGAAIWNLNDFYSETRGDAVPNINNKGITGVDREIKNTYTLYKAHLNKTPMLKIGTGTWKIRGGVVGADYTCIQPVKVYTNGSQVELKINGKSLGTKPAQEHIALFDVPFVNGENTLEASAVIDGKELKDMLVVDFRAVAPSLSDSRLPFGEINVMLGSDRYFEDREGSMVWLPERAYTEGSWGYIGGEKVVTKTRHGSLPASDIEIIDTDQDPIFQTQRKSIESMRFDVPNGTYSVYLYFAELVSDKEREALAYNLGNDAIVEKRSEPRVFGVSINDVPQLRAFDIARECGAERAIIKKFVVTVTDGKGVVIDFNKVSSEPVLNAVRLYKMY